ncbi:MAG: LacI family DNA-binding transcriptional regulator [Hyphomonadaceae bacterium]|nr:LacI family DNA-binding transcriptional regulator [Clostridia bacterium]
MNIYDIARETGLSIATVSRVINQDKNVSDKTRTKVQSAIERFGYVPNAVARGLAVNASKTVGLAVIDIRDTYYATVAHTIERELAQLGYNCLLFNTGVQVPEKIHYIHIMQQKRVDAIILVGSVFNDEHLNVIVQKAAKKTPVVLVNSTLDVPNVYAVLCDDAAGTRACVHMLAESGRKNILFINDAHTYSANAKTDGFKQGMADNGLPCNEDSIYHAPKGIEGAQQLVNDLLQQGKHFDAVMTSEDVSALGVLKALKQNEIAVPQAVAVVGYNNSVFSTCTMPELTTIDSGMEQMAKGATEVLKQVFEGLKPKAVKRIMPNLVTRQTT